MSKPTDGEILVELARNVLASMHLARSFNSKNSTKIPSSFFLRSLKRLEKDGEVERVDARNKSTIFWRAASKAAS